MDTLTFRLKRIFLLLIVGYLVLQSPTDAVNITLNNGIISGVTVGISSSISVSQQKNLLSAIGALFDAANPVLYNATDNRTYFGDVTVILYGTNVAAPRTLRSNVLRSSIRATSDSQEDNFQTAHIRIDLTNAAYGDMPYVQQSRGCGAQGDFIHLSQAFVLGSSSLDVTKLGSREKLFVQQWIKFRYGVFDEFGYSDDQLYPQQYHDSNGNTQDNVCSNDNNIEWDNSQTSCSSSDHISTKCTFKLSNNNPSINSSIMSTPILTAATTLCNTSSHNRDAPNKQNSLCGMQSAWEVMMNHPDFANNKSPQQGSKDSFSSVQISTNYNSGNSTLGIYVVWDFLNYDQTFSAKPSLMKFCNQDLPYNSYMGSILSGESTPSNPLKQITSVNHTSNCQFINGLPINATTSTSMLKTAISGAVASLTSPTYTHKSILVFSSTASLSVGDWNTICTAAQSPAGVIIHLFTYTDEAVKNFLDPGSGCQGQAFSIQSSDLQNNLLGSTVNQSQCLASLQARSQLDLNLINIPTIMDPDSYIQPEVYFQETFNTSRNSSFYLDVTSTVVTSYFYMYTCTGYFMPASYLSGWIASPDNVLSYNSDTYSFLTPSYGVLGTSSSWIYYIKEIYNSSYTPYVVTAFGRSTQGAIGDSSPKITVSSWTSVEDVGAYSKVIVFASVKRGTTPILNAGVTATIISGSGKNKYNITLVDDGSGNPDISKGDGLYSSYFTQIEGSDQTYSITVNITDKNRQANYATQPAYWITGSSPPSPSSIGTFSRSISSGTVFVSGQNGDTMPPGKINDLHVAGYGSGLVTLAWTAPGDDLDYGQAKKYYLKCDSNPDNLVSIMSDTINDLQNVPTPGQAKTLQSTTLTDSAATTKYCAIKAGDDNNNYGEMSNVVPYYIVTSGLSSAQKGGIAAGVIIAVILIVLIILFFCCCYGTRCCVKKEKEEDVDNFRPAQPVAAYNPGNGNGPTVIMVGMGGNDVQDKVDAENQKSAADPGNNNNRKNQDGNGSDSSESGLDTSDEEEDVGHGRVELNSVHSAGGDSRLNQPPNNLVSFQNSRTPSPSHILAGNLNNPNSNYRNPGTPYQPPVTMIQLNPVPPTAFVAVTPTSQPYNYRYDNVPEQQYHPTPDVAVPIRLEERSAVIVPTAEYRNPNYNQAAGNNPANFTDLPVYAHILNKAPMAPPHAPPRAPGSSSSSSSSDSRPSSKKVAQV